MKMPRRTLICMAMAASGLAMGAAVSYGTWWLAGVALIPVLAVSRDMPLRRTWLPGAAAGAIQGAMLWAWIGSSTALLDAGMWPGILMTVLLALCRAAWTGCFLLAFEAARRLMARRSCEPCMLVSGPAFWVILEWVYEQFLVWLGLPFSATLGYSQAWNPVTVQVAALLGVHGVSFLLVFLNVALTGWLAGRSAEPSVARAAARLSLIAAVVMAAAWGGGGAARLALARRDSATDLVRVAILQGNIPPYLKYDKSKSNELAQRYLRLGAQANAHRPQLVVWSEAAIPWPFEDDDDLGSAMLEATRASQAYHVVGAVSRSTLPGGGCHNSAFFIHPDGRVTARYDKVGLFLFTERGLKRPGQDAARRLHPSSRYLVPGRSLAPMDTPFGKFGVNICNENFYARRVRRSVRDGAGLLLNLGNDIWIRNDCVLKQHFAANVLRAVENGRDTIMSNNPGISGIIDKWGRIRMTSEPRTAVCQPGSVMMRSGQTVYTRTGDFFIFLCLLAATIPLLIRVIPRL